MNTSQQDLEILENLSLKKQSFFNEISKVLIGQENILNQIEKIHDVELPGNLIQQELALISQGLKKEDIEKNKKGFI